MQRTKALIASALVATTVTVGAGLYIAESGLLDGGDDNVGNLQPVAATLETTAPTTAAAQEVTVYYDPATGAMTSNVPIVGADGTVATVPGVATQPIDPSAPAQDTTSDDDRYDDRDDDRYDDDRHEKDDHDNRDDHHERDDDDD